ncbi:NAD(P)-dependent oxidoreductase [Pseudocnuella soli]|uniref:NAD(P)-dependent oxidoreductase n=1 Tax=Pseudocnuella soli TaxID=2502779 RepID=UPI001042BE33|nr:NAD(P)-dependent oxidoreductase [Pseudocnuella soli]
MIRKKILIAEPENFSLQAINLLSEVGSVYRREITSDELTVCFANYDVIIFRLKFKIDDILLPQNPRCKILATPVTGLDHINIEACKRKGIDVISLKGEFDFLRSVRATAELTIGLTLALLRHIPRAVIHTQQGNWERDLFRGNEIYKKKVGVIGLGRLGTIVAEYFKVFGAEVIGYDPRPDFPYDMANRVDHISDIFREAEIITIHVAYNNTTHNLVGQKEFSNINGSKPFLINTSRGGVINEEALLNALKDGLIRGAALDVVQDEHNMSLNNHLIEYSRKNDNLLISPHIGGNTFESFVKTEMFIAQKIVQKIQALA